MNRVNHHQIRYICVALCLCSGLANAQQWVAPLNLSLKPRLLNSEFVTADSDAVREARLGSGLALNLASRLLEFDVDYRLQSVLKETAAVPQGVLSQLVTARLQSALLNDLLGVDAGVRADTVSREGGDVFRYQITPGLSRPLHDLAHFRFNYDYIVHKQARQQSPTEKRGYSMALDGSLHGGRLVWRGSYRSASEFGDRLALTRDSEGLDLKSSYQIGRAMRVEIFSAFQQATRLNGAAREAVNQRRYGAGFSWLPSAQYALAFRLNTLESDQRDRRGTFGSGTLSWFPRPELELTLDYGERIAGGAPGWMLHTRLDLEG